MLNIQKFILEKESTPIFTLACQHYIFLILILLQDFVKKQKAPKKWFFLYFLLVTW